MQKSWIYGLFAGVGALLAVAAVVYLSSPFDKNGRCWHDKAAGTVVVTAAEAPHSNSDGRTVDQ